MRAPAPLGLIGSLIGIVSGCAATEASALNGGGALTNLLMAPLGSPTLKYVAAPTANASDVAVRSLASRGDRLAVTLRSPPGAGGTIRRARVATPEATPCAAGWAADAAWRDGWEQWQRPLALAGDLELGFTVPRSELRVPLVIDLAIEDAGGARCLRAPLGAPFAGLAMARASRTSLGGGFDMLLGRPTRADGAPVADSAAWGVQVSGSVGAWTGRWRWSGRIDACIGNCSAKYAVALPVTAQVERLLFASRWLSTAASAGYQLGRIDDIISSIGGRSAWYHGPRVGVLFLGGRPFAGADPAAPFAARGIEVFLIRQLSGAGAPQFQRPEWILGLGVVAL